MKNNLEAGQPSAEPAELQVVVDGTWQGPMPGSIAPWEGVKIPEPRKEREPAVSYLGQVVTKQAHAA